MHNGHRSVLFGWRERRCNWWHSKSDCHRHLQARLECISSECLRLRFQPSHPHLVCFVSWAAIHESESFMRSLTFTFVSKSTVWSHPLFHNKTSNIFDPRFSLCPRSTTTSPTVRTSTVCNSMHFNTRGSCSLYCYSLSSIFL